MCQTEWESANPRREAHGSRSLCAYHHPDLAGIPPATTLPPLGRVKMNAELDQFKDCETKWPLETNKSVEQVYWQTLTPTPDGIYVLPLTTVCGDLIFMLAVLMTMATGALVDNKMQTERINAFIEKSWLKRGSVNLTKEMFKKEILRRHDILCLWSVEEGVEKILIYDAKHMTMYC